MKLKFQAFFGMALAGGLLWFMNGCAAPATVDWNSRVGSYSYEQATAELGHPAKSETAADGGKVAEWLTRRDENRTFLGLGTGVSASGAGAGIAQPLGPQPHDEYLRLTFDKEGRLRAWKRTFH